MSKLFESGATLLVSLLLIASCNYLVAEDAMLIVNATDTPVDGLVKTATFGFFWKPYFEYWPSSYCSWDYYTTGVWEIVFIGGGDCSKTYGAKLAASARTRLRTRTFSPYVHGGFTIDTVQCTKSAIKGLTTYTVRAKTTKQTMDLLRTTRSPAGAMFTSSSLKTVGIPNRGSKFLKSTWIKNYWCSYFDACAATPSPCDVNADCTDQAPPSISADCTCKTGYTGAGTPGNCADFDACAANPSPCDVNADCTDQAPPSISADCTCKTGYTGAGTPGNCAECAPQPQSVADFNSSGYMLGSINQQNGWTTQDSFTTTVTVGIWDQAIVVNGAGNKVWRVSNTITNNGFSSQPFSYITDVAGESGASLWNDRGTDGSVPTNPPGFGANATTKQFYARIAFRSATGAGQNGLAISLPASAKQSPVRMTNPRIIDDGVSGFRIEVTELGNNGTFPLSNLVIAQNISYNALNTLEFTIQFVDGVNLTTGEVNGNDIVTYYLNGMKIHTGTTWEAYYYWNERITPQNPRIQAVNSVIFRLAGTAATTTGFYFEEVLLATRFCPH